MKRTPITVALADFPETLHPWLAGARIYDSSCSREARVLFIDREDGYFLKRAPAGTLEREALLNAYFHRKGLSAEVVLYLARRDGADWLLTRRVRGEDCTHATYLAEPRRLAVLLGERLRELHGESTAGCPVSDRMGSYFATARENFLGGRYDLSYFATDYGDADAEQIYRIAQEGRTGLSSDTLLHGDYCLPNILLDGWRFSGFIDLGGGGVGDRHVDLYWGAWTLRFNLGTDEFRDVFFDAYGRDRIDSDALRVIAAAECFG